jgi:uncharacterized membrane protein YkvA (DUF1232 family)
MRLSPIAVMRRLGLRRFLQLVTYLPSFLKLFVRLAKDPRVPLRTKLLLAGVLAYLIFPADVFPDFLLGLGQLDDLVVIFLGLKLFLRLCPKEAVQEHVRSIAAGR